MSHAANDNRMRSFLLNGVMGFTDHGANLVPLPAQNEHKGHRNEKQDVR